MRSRAGGGPGRRATLVPPREHKERGAWPGRPRGSAPSRAAAKLSKKFEAGGERSFGVGVSPVLHLSLCRGAEPERSCVPPLAARGTDWVGTPLPPRALSHSWRCLRGSVRETQGAPSRPGRADSSYGSTQHGQVLRDSGTVLTSAACTSTPHLLGDSKTPRLRSSGGGPGGWAGCDGVLRPRIRASQFQFFYAFGLSTNHKG